MRDIFYINFLTVFLVAGSSAIFTLPAFMSIQELEFIKSHLQFRNIVFQTAK